jgi:hypothetical protein
MMVSLLQVCVLLNTLLIPYLDPVCATLVHPSGSVIATVAGKDRNASNGSEGDGSSDSEDRSGDPEVISESSESGSSNSESDEEDEEEEDDEQDGEEDSCADSMLKIWSIT